MKNQLYKKIHSLSLKDEPFRPVLLDLSKTSGRETLAKLFKKNEILHISDDYEEQAKELFAIQNPSLVYQPSFGQLFQNHLEKLRKKSDLAEQGMWVFFPWNHTLVHILKDVDFQKVRTARNRHLINSSEQELFYGATVGIGGLSVGNSVIMAIVLQGGARHIKLADFDRLALSNLNRIRGSITGLGMRKAEITARQIYELNPYATVEIFSDGITPENIEKFFSSPKLDIVIDELDNIAVKFLIREQARKHKVAVVMGADDGDNAVVDIERYDLKPSTPFFQGRLGNVTYDSLKNLDKFGIGKTIAQHIGPENITERMQQSLMEMGKTIVSWPQLGGAALLNGSAVAYCVRKILNHEPLEHNRAIISLDEKFIPNYFSKAEIAKRKKIVTHFKKMFGL